MSDFQTLRTTMRQLRVKEAELAATAAELEKREAELRGQLDALQVGEDLEGAIHQLEVELAQQESILQVALIDVERKSWITQPDTHSL